MALTTLVAIAGLVPLAAASVVLEGASLFEELETVKAGFHHGSEKRIRLPEFFDARQVWWGCGSTVHNQGQCGSCWAASATSVLNDRFCIHMGGDDDPLTISRYGAGSANRAFMEAGSCDRGNVLPHDHGCTKRTTILSPQRVVSCASASFNPEEYHDSVGCNGGDAGEAWKFFHDHGVASMSGDHNNGCSPYVSGKCLLKDPHNDGCLTCQATLECSDTGLDPKLYKVGEYGYIRDPGLQDYNETVPINRTALGNQIRMMKHEIFANGPIQSCFVFPMNFQTFFNENPLAIYNTTKHQNISGSHCVTLTGWGRDASTGDSFGTKGYYRWKLGEDLCGIEREAWTGCPLGSKTCRLTPGVVKVNSEQLQNRHRDIAHGGKWMTHAGDSYMAQFYAHNYMVSQAKSKSAPINHVMEIGSYDVLTVQTKVTNGVVARLIMSPPGVNGNVEIIMTHNMDDTIAIIGTKHVEM